MKFTIISVEEAKAKTPSWSGEFAKPFVIFNNETNHPAHTCDARAEAEKIVHIFNTSKTA